MNRSVLFRKVWIGVFCIEKVSSNFHVTFWWTSPSLLFPVNAAVKRSFIIFFLGYGCVFSIFLELHPIELFLFIACFSFHSLLFFSFVLYLLFISLFLNQVLLFSIAYIWNAWFHLLLLLLFYISSLPILATVIL